MNDIKPGQDKFYIGDDEAKPLAEITFVLEGDDRLIIEHTRVSEALRGGGVGRRLVDAVAGLARSENKKIISHCPYAKKILAGNAEYSDVLVPGGE